MKTKAFLFASRLATLALACILTFSLIACSKDDEEPTIDDLLSEETTPITFDLAKEGTHFLFDYAGSNLVGSDTIDVRYYFSEKKYTTDLRQGKHRLVWMRGLCESYEGKEGKTFFYARPYYDVESKMIECLEGDAELNFSFPLPQYYVMDIDVTPYLMPEQQIKYQPLCAQIYFNLSCDFSVDDDVDIAVTGVPFIKAVGIDTNRYTIGDTKNEVTFATTFYGDQNRYNTALFSKDILCPKEGFNNVQLSYKVIRNGATIYSVSLPAISLQRGYETIISGPLVGGQTGDYTVNMRPYDGN